ncbi:MAG: (2Fe-2S) ferredoxin domain-containing protein [Sphingomonas sp.]|uniref:(2Fe-2S) ferredoxin domain-containing protein n=1 Tax=Sphingomonas sp. TaxID=28214 RepID=UPI0025D4A656|nr:(2Fe-2S) ferredoxin domain-containing protein [Sphingomonas sp.]MBX9858241.1 (2Fe-2S) ferredoxin domain-containing protein [Sphingomonas sp.]MBY0282975.1 (2Fe-2S) ferredoxin domain-containing protein [Sphingomonas sp.]
MTKLVKADWETAILVCAKCSKRLEGGFGKKGKQRLAKALKAYLGVKRFRKARIGVVEVKCLGVCPRGAVTVVNAAHPSRWRLVAKGADLATVTADLGVGPQAVE